MCNINLFDYKYQKYSGLIIVIRLIEWAKGGAGVQILLESLQMQNVFPPRPIELKLDGLDIVLINTTLFGNV